VNNTRLIFLLLENHKILCPWIIGIQAQGNLTSYKITLFLAETLGKAELVKTELEGDLHKSRAEEAALKDALAKMQALNEGLGQDKIELNKIIMMVCTEFTLYH